MENVYKAQSKKAMKYTIMFFLLLVCATAFPQESDFMAEYEKFRQQAKKEYNDFRQQAHRQYADFVKEAWQKYRQKPGIPQPIEKDVPPVTLPTIDRNKPLHDRPIVIDKVTKPTPLVPQPMPLQPIEEVPEISPKYTTCTFFGTQLRVRFDKSKLIHLVSANERDVADAIGKIRLEDYDNLTRDCLALRRSMQLSDWAYLGMLKTISIHIAGEYNNDAVLLMMFLYMQSGYKMRVASDHNRIYMLFASRHVIYNSAYYDLDGEYYYGMEELPGELYISGARFPKEKSMSLQITQQPKFSENNGETRTITSKQYEELKVNVSVNRNLIDFYNTYPVSTLGQDFMTKWTVYANAEMEQGVQRQLYPALKKILDGHSQRECVDGLLNWVQTGFEYEYDEEIWGHDRAFFAEESLYYPYCDCEDRAILFTRLVRDIVGLKCVLVYYPGHLAAAVEFTDDTVNGDIINIGEHRFVVCDPTYIGAPVGMTMRGMDNNAATVVLLE